MSTDRILTAIGVLLAIVAAFVALEWWALILVLLGLLSGFLSPLTDMAARTGYTVAAIALPTIADALDAIPMAGSYLNALSITLPSLLPVSSSPTFCWSLSRG